MTTQDTPSHGVLLQSTGDLLVHMVYIMEFITKNGE